MGAKRSISGEQEEVTDGDQFDLDADEMDAMEAAVEEVARRRKTVPTEDTD